MSLNVSGKQKIKQNSSLTLSRVKALSLGTFLGFLIFLSGLVIVSLILMKTESDTETIYYALYIFVGLGAFASAIFSQKRISGRGFITGTLSSLPYLFLLIITSAVMLNFNISFKIFVLVPICIISGFLGGITAVNTK